MSSPLPLDRCSVLVVEDDPIIALDLIFSLEDAGAEVHGPCVTNDRALSEIDKRVIHAAVLDVDIGNSDVSPVADALKSRGIPFVFHTGTLPQGNAVLSRSDAPVLGKPCRPEDLVAAVLKVIEKAEAGTE